MERQTIPNLSDYLGSLWADFGVKGTISWHKNQWTKEWDSKNFLRQSLVLRCFTSPPATSVLDLDSALDGYISVVEIVWYHFYLSTNVLGYPDVVRIALLMQYVTSKLELMLQVFDCMLGKSIQGRVPVNFNRMLWCTCNRHTSIRMSFWIDWSVLLTKVWWSNHPGFVSLVHILAVASILQKYVQPVIAGGCRVRGVL